MSSATLVDAPVKTIAHVSLRPAPFSTDALGEEIAALAARLHAATYELLLLLREFDERTGWNNGFASVRIGCTGAPASPWEPPARRSASRTRWRPFRS